MGCFASRPDKPCHEVVLMNAEISLLYSTQNISQLFSSLKSISKASLIEFDDFKNFLKDNRLSSTSRSLDFYETLLTVNSLKLNQIATLVCILTKSPVKDKAKVLYEAWADGGLRKENLSEMIDSLFDMAIVYLPMLITPDIYNSIEKADMNELLVRCAESRSAAKESMVNEIEVDRGDDGIAEWFSKKNNECWLCSYGIRDFLRNFNKKVIKKKEKSGRGESVDSKANDLTAGICNEDLTGKID